MSCFVTTAKLSFFACQKDASGAGAALKNAAPALGSGQQKNQLRLQPRNTGEIPTYCKSTTGTDIY